MMQWAAVSTHWSLMRVPPHLWTPDKCMLTCQGHDPAVAFSPPTILVFRGATPQSDRARITACQYVYSEVDSCVHFVDVFVHSCWCSLLLQCISWAFAWLYGIYDMWLHLPWAFVPVEKREIKKKLLTSAMCVILGPANLSMDRSITAVADMRNYRHRVALEFLLLPLRGCRILCSYFISFHLLGQ